MKFESYQAYGLSSSNETNIDCPFLLSLALTVTWSSLSLSSFYLVLGWWCDVNVQENHDILVMPNEQMCSVFENRQKSSVRRSMPGHGKFWKRGDPKILVNTISWWHCLQRQMNMVSDKKKRKLLMCIRSQEYRAYQSRDSCYEKLQRIEVCCLELGTAVLANQILCVGASILCIY